MNVEHEGDEGNSVGSKRHGNMLYVEVSKGSHNVSIHKGVCLTFVLICLDSLFTFRGDVVLEKILFGHARREFFFRNLKLCFFQLEWPNTI